MGEIPTSDTTVDFCTSLCTFLEKIRRVLLFLKKITALACLSRKISLFVRLPYKFELRYYGTPEKNRQRKQRGPNSLHHLDYNDIDIKHFKLERREDHTLFL